MPRIFWNSCALNLLAALLAAGSSAQAQSELVKAIFEKYNLIGTFAWDCSQPPSNNNWYFVNRLLDADHVQRDFMTGTSTREWAAIIDQASELRPNEVAWSSIRDGQRIVGVWHVDQNRMLQWSATSNGKDIISSGKSVSTGKDMPRLNRCGP